MRFQQASAAEFGFLTEMLYEAVYWRPSNSKPSPAQASAQADFTKWLADWGKRPGDQGVVAYDNRTAVGAVWLRYWSADDGIRGYHEQATPVLVIGVKKPYRGQGIGEQLIHQLVELARAQSIAQISLMVSKDNPAIGLYRKTGFIACTDCGDSLVMLRALT